jgi:23S rRNA (uracil1939-C5)-methyltransferase
MGSAGDGIADTPDGPLHIPRALPGEVVRARPAGRGQAVLEEVLTASPERVAPPCPHFTEGCGGCALQHWDIAAQSAWKRGRLAEALARAGYPDAPVAPVADTPPNARRRADLAIRRDHGGAVRVGFHARGTTEVLDLRECHVLDPRIFALLAPLRALLRRLPALAKDGSALVNLLDTGPDLLLRTDRTLDAPGRRLLAAFAEALRLPRIAWAERDGLPETAAQSAPVRLGLSGAEVAPPPGAFLQASPQGEAAIVAAVLAGLPAKLPKRAHILDLYAGLGTLSLPLSAHGRVTAAEGDADAVAALRKASGRVQAVRRDLARQPFLPPELKGLRRGGARPALCRRGGAGGAARAQRGAACRLCLLQPGGAGARRGGAARRRVRRDGGDAGGPVPLVVAPGIGGRLRALTISGAPCTATSFRPRRGRACIGPGAPNLRRGTVAREKHVDGSPNGRAGRGRRPCRARPAAGLAGRRPGPSHDHPCTAVAGAGLLSPPPRRLHRHHGA